MSALWLALRCRHRLLRIDDSAMSVVSGDSQLTPMIVFGRDFNQPAAALCMLPVYASVTPTARSLHGLHGVVVLLHCRCCRRW